MDFRILGPFEVWDGERQLDLAGSKRRAVLAFLVLHANEVVSADRLVDQLWGDKAPRNAAAALHTHVSRLRKELGPELVATRAWGYVLRTEPEAIDLDRFEQLVVEAENLPARERAEKLRAALALWRGGPLEDLAFEPALAKDIARLEELRLAVLENRIDADLEAGDHNGIVGELEALIAENPLRERLRGQLILALYRSGRQAEALEVYRETRRVLTEELGLEPSPELRELERAILRQDPSLAAAAGSVESRAGRQPPPGRRRRLYLGALAVVLLGAIAAAAAFVATRGTSVAGRAAPAVTQITTTTSVTAPTAKAPRRTHTRPAVRHTSHAANNAVPTATTKRARTTKPVVRQRRTRPPAPAAHPPSTLVNKTKPKPPPQTKPTKAVRIADDFSDPTLDPLIWTSWSSGTGARAAQQNGQLTFSIAANATFESHWHTVGISVGTVCKFPGDFDARVDYTLPTWPIDNGAAASLVAYATTPVNAPIEEISRASNSYGDGEHYSDWPAGRGNVLLGDTSGSLRIARSKGVLRSYFWHHEQWKELGQQTISGEIWVGMTLSAFAKDWQQDKVSAAFDNFVVTAADGDCPAGSGP